MLKIRNKGTASTWFEVGNSSLKELLKELEPTTKVHLYRAYGDNNDFDTYDGFVKDVPENYRRLNNKVNFAYQNNDEDTIYIATGDVDVNFVK